MRHSQAKELLGLQKLEEEGKFLPWRLQRECGSADALIWDFRSPQLGGKKFLLFEVPQMWHFVRTALRN